MSDIENFLCNTTVQPRCVLLFPPVNKYRRFLIHKLIDESFSQKNLQTLSVGKDFGRRTAVFCRTLLKSDFIPPEIPVKAIKPVKPKPIQPLSPMVNKNTEKNKPRTPFAGIYRPPAVRKLLSSKSEQSIPTCDSPPITPVPPSSSEKKSTRVKRPDQQVYVPRPKRLSRNNDGCPATVTKSDKSLELKNKVFICEKRSKVRKRENDESCGTKVECVSESIPAERVHADGSEAELQILRGSVSDILDSEEKDPKSERLSASTTDITDLNSSLDSTFDEHHMSITESPSLPIDQSFSSIDSSLAFDSSQNKLSESKLSLLTSDCSFQSHTPLSVSAENESFDSRLCNDSEVLDYSQSADYCFHSTCDDAQTLELNNLGPNQSLRVLDNDSSSEVPKSFLNSTETEGNASIDTNCTSDNSIYYSPENKNISSTVVEVANIGIEIPSSELLTSSPCDKTDNDIVILDDSLESKKCCKLKSEDSSFSAKLTEEKNPSRKSFPDEEIFVKPAEVADDWELLLNENGQLFDPSLLKELEEAVGKVTISRPTCNYKDFQSIEERTSDGECIIEIYGFVPEFRTHDLMNIFSPFCGKNFQIAWVDDTHALGVFSSPTLADELLSTELPFVKTRPLREGIPESRIKASKLVLPPLTRPKTCPALARRLVTGALGLRLPTSKSEREAERKVLKEARDKKRLEAKIKRDIWEGN